MTAETGSSPRIIRSTWGRMEVEGIAPAKDFKLWPGGGRPWDWGETGTHHSPGIQRADVEELVDRGADVVVLGRGRELALQVSSKTLEWLRDQRVTVHVEETGAGVDLYNELVGRGTKVGGLFHSTC